MLKHFTVKKNTLIQKKYCVKTVFTKSIKLNTTGKD